MSELEALSIEYYELMSRQQLVESELDYSVMEKHKVVLHQLSLVGNSGITVFDLCRKEHAFTSYNFQSLFGYDFDKIQTEGTEYFNSRIHPEDYVELMRAGVALFKFYYHAPEDERNYYKLVNEYRVLNAESKYIRVIEQHQLLELDKHGNPWLALSVLDIAPDQKELHGVNSQLMNYQTGKIHPLIFQDDQASLRGNGGLTKREKEILFLVKDGLLSKEISEKLCISIHTVNTHRQRILEKLNADNAMEAVTFASKLGLLQ